MAIAIEVTDKVSGNVAPKIEAIGKAARETHKAVQDLKTALASVNDSALNRMMRETVTQTSRLSTEADKAALAAQRLATEQQRAATAAQRLQTETQRTAKAASDAAAAQTMAAQKLATEQQRTAKASADVAAAQSRAQLAADKLAQSQQKAADAANRHARGLDTLKGLLASVGFAVAANSVLKLADGYTNLQNKLQNVSESQTQVEELTTRMFELARRTRTDVDATATAFTRFDRALKIMGKSQDETFRMTETVNKGLIVSGATAQEAASTLLQLSQAFNAGKLQGDEFRSLAENFPMILDATAKAMGVTVDQVKQMSTEGKITSKVLFDALKLIEGQVDKTFGKTVPTISQAGTVMRTSIMEAVGQLDKAIGVTATLSRGILFLADNMQYLVPITAGLGTALVLAFGPQLVRVFQLATNAVQAFTMALMRNPLGLVAVALATITTALLMYAERTKASAEQTTILRDHMVAAFSYVKDAWNAVTKFFGEAWDTAVKFVSESLQGWGTSFSEIYEVITIGAKQYANLMIKLWQTAFATVSFVWGNFPSLMQNFFVAVYNYSAGIVESVVNSWQSGMRIIADSIESFAPSASAGIREVLESTRLELSRLDYSQDGLNNTQNYLDRIKDIWAADPVGQVADDWTKRATDAQNARLKLAEERAKSLRGQGPAAPTAPPGDAKGKASKQFTFNDAVRELERETELLKMNRIEREKNAQLNQLEDKLGKDRNGKRIEFNKTQRETLMNMLNEQELLRNRAAMLEEITGPETRLMEGQAALNSLLNDGSITAQQYADNMRDLNIAFLETQTTMDSGFQRGILKMQKEVNNLSTLTESFVTNGIQGMENGLVELATTGKMNFANFAQSIISDLARMAVRALITRAIMMAIGAIGGSISGMNAVSTTPAMGSAIGAGGSLESFMGGPAAFSKGGWTGNGAKDAIAGAVHGQEFVVKAGPAAANRELLEAMNRGQKFAVPVSNDSAPASSSAAPASSAHYMSAPVGASATAVQVVINNTQSDKVSVRAEEERGEDGSTKINVMVDMVENQLAGRLQQGRGPLFNSMRSSFGLNANPKGA